MTFDGNKINIKTKQEIHEMGGVRTLEFTQQLSLPSDAQGHQIQKSLSQEGELVITAPRGEWIVKKPERQSELRRSTTIPITVEQRPNNQKKSLSTPEQPPVTEKAKNVKKSEYDDFDYD